MTQYSAQISQLEKNVSLAVFGKRQLIRRCFVALFAAEHILLEDVPGVGKTLLAQAVARSIAGQFNRIQFTPDLLPADITGSSIYDPASNSFQFSKGALFANIVLADEINRTTPRTQSAMLEAMDERQVSADGTTYPLPSPFMVIATENPVEFEGTYPLPESQLDRFLLRISVGYPDRQSELHILKTHQVARPIDSLQPVLSVEQILEIQKAVSSVHVADSINQYILDIVEATRSHDELLVGVSTRGAIALSRAVQALALIEDRDFVIPDDVKTLAVPVLAHRIVPKSVVPHQQRKIEETLIARILDSTPVPVGD